MDTYPWQLARRTALQPHGPLRAKITIWYEDACSEENINKRRKRAALREDDQEAEEKQHDDNRQQPVFLPGLKVIPEIFY